MLVTMESCLLFEMLVRMPLIGEEEDVHKDLTVCKHVRSLLGLHKLNSNRLAAKVMGLFPSTYNVPHYACFVKKFLI